MTQTGFFAQKRNSPTSLAMVVLLHGAVLAAVIMIKGPQFIIQRTPPTIVESYPIDQDPPPVPPEQPRRQQRSQIAQPEQVIDTRTTTQTVTTTDDPPQRQTQFADAGETVAPPRQPDPPPAVRRGAELDPRYSDKLQPPYPASEHRAQREGRVQVRVTIAPSGRVSAVARLMATSDAFWRVTEQQALNHWRFRPATLDGRPVEDNKVMTLHFRLVDQ